MRAATLTILALALLSCRVQTINVYLDDQERQPTAEVPGEADADVATTAAKGTHAVAIYAPWGAEKTTSIDADATAALTGSGAAEATSRPDETDEPPE